MSVPSGLMEMEMEMDGDGIGFYVTLRLLYCRYIDSLACIGRD